MLPSGVSDMAAECRAMFKETDRLGRIGEQRMRATSRAGTAVRTAAAIVAVSLIAAACGSSGGGSGGGASVSTATPKAGGKLVMGVEAEVDGFDPTQNRMDVTGLTYASTVYDALGAFGKDGKVHPYLAESIDHNADYSV